MAQMIPNMAVLPLAKAPARAQIEKVQSTPREERRNDDTRHSGSAQALGLCRCRKLYAFVRWHGTWPDSWQLAFCSRASVLYGLHFAVGYKFYALSHFLNCHGLTQGLAFALHFRAPRPCLQCDRHERRCPGQAPGNNSTQEVTQWKQLDCWSPLKHAQARRPMPKHS